MLCYFVAKPRLVGPHTPEEERAFQDADTTGAIISMLGDSIVDTYLSLQTSKEMWDVLEFKYRVSDADSELYIIEQFHDYRMGYSKVEQAHRYKH